MNQLAQVRALRVTARTSSFAFKGTTETVDRIASQLNVGHVLEGSVRKAGNQLVITAQLIDTTSGFHLWSSHTLASSKISSRSNKTSRARW